MKLYDLLPPVYYDQSRDFAFINRLQEIVFNYMKTAADNTAVTANKDTSGLLLDLTTDTFGFEQRHSYNIADLAAITSIFAELLRKKGSEAAIKEAVSALISTQKLTNVMDNTAIEHDPNDYLKIDIKIPPAITDTVLLEDLFDYILPVGVIYTLTKTVSSNIMETAVKSTTPSGQVEGTARTDPDLGSVVTSVTDVERDYLGVVVSSLPDPKDESE